MLLSDRDIRAELASGRIGLEPLDPEMVQPSSIDVRLDRYFRLFDNHKYPFIDPAEDQPDLTRLVEVDPDQPFILHPGEFVLGSTYELVTLPDDVAARLEGKSSLGRLGLLDALDRGLRRPGVLRSRDARALQRRHAADQAVAGHEDRAALLHPHQLAGRERRTARVRTATGTRGSAGRPHPARSRTSTARMSRRRMRASPVPEVQPSWASCSPSHGLNAYGAAVTAARRSSSATHSNSATSSGAGRTASAVVAR